MARTTGLSIDPRLAGSRWRGVDRPRGCTGWCGRHSTQRRRRRGMAKYLVERYLPGLTPEQLAAAAGSAKRTTATMRQEGTPVQYLRSTFIPGEEKCFCLFEGPSAEVVRTANDRAQLPYERIVEAMHVASDDLG